MAVNADGIDNLEDVTNEVEESNLNLEEDLEEEEEESENEDLDEESRHSLYIDKTLDDMMRELGRVNVSWPEAKISDYAKRKYFPPSYMTLTNKEKVLLWHTENFRRQYLYAYPDRKPLLLAPENDCGVQKFVSTTLRPKRLRYLEMYDYNLCAHFVADYFDYEELYPPTKLPKRLRSPATVIKQRLGNCFEISTVLCSFLLGAGYDAYVVSGYATREVCKRNMEGDVCPLLVTKPKPVEAPEEEPKLKYQIKPPKQLHSRFKEEMAAREIRKKEEEERIAIQEEEARIRKMEEPPPDPLLGTRIHSWVFVQAGNRELAEPFFIEPLTGDRQSLSDPRYQGLESMWNHRNYWVNLQKCYEGCKKLHFDLKDTMSWDHLLLCEQGDPPISKNTEEDEDEAPQEGQRHLDMPTSWVENLDIDFENFETRYPNGSKTVFYKKAKLERYAPFLLSDGVITCVTSYYDYERQHPTLVKEWFQDRSDKLLTRELSLLDNWDVERFDRGREDYLKEHWHRPNNYSLEGERRLIFYSSAREDGLEEVTTQAREMKCTYKNRKDHLLSRAAHFGVRGILTSSSAPESTKRPVQWILEQYSRNPEKPGSEDIFEREILVSEEKINLKYHYDDQKITNATRQYIKPPLPQYGEQIPFNMDLTGGYQVDPRTDQAKQLELYRKLEAEMVAEQKAIKRVRDMEEEISSIMKNRTTEGLYPKLLVSIYDPLRNEDAKRSRKAWEEEQEKLKAVKAEADVDVLAPYLARIGYPSKLTRQQALKIREQCLVDYKQLLVDRANHIQELHDKTSSELQERQKWYDEEQDELTQEQEEEHIAYCTNTMFLIHTYESRLQRHIELAPKKYYAMEQRLQSDERLILHA